MNNNTFGFQPTGGMVTEVEILGQLDDGTSTNLKATQEGHLEVAIHDPILPFGSVHAENLTPIFQTDAVYGINPQQVVATTGLSVGIGAGSATNTGTSNLFKCSTGTTQYSFASMQSRRRLRYRPGQGVVARFTALFSSPVANSILVARVGTSECGYFFGYNGTSFGILHSTGGVREIHTFTITTASTSTQSYQVTQPNTQVITITATNNNNTARTAYEISQGSFVGWEVYSSGSTVIFVASSAGPITGSFSLAQSGAATPAAGTDAETTAGVSPTNTWIPQTEWNGDRLLYSTDPDNSPSQTTLNTLNGNVFQIGIQYLGFGAIEFKVEVCPTDGNNPILVTVHTLRFPNTRTTVTQNQPAFPFTMAAYSSGSTTNVSVSVASFAGFIEGQKISIGPRETYYNNNGITSSISAYIPLFTVKNGYSFASRANQVVSNLIGIGAAAKSTNGLTTFYLIKDATLTGPTNFAAWASNSPTLVDTSSTGCSFTNNNQVVWSGGISESGQDNYAFSDHEITMQPGESYTLAVRSVTSTSTCIGSLNTREDQ